MPTFRMSGIIPPIHYAFRAWRLIRHRGFNFLPSLGLHCPTYLKQSEKMYERTVSLLVTPRTHTHVLAEICRSRRHIKSYTFSLPFRCIFNLLKIVSDNNCRLYVKPVGTLGAKT
jgi:hypothetical protein